ncbi:hypothetical protein B6259_01865 [Ruminococcaceae bacterium CPB6]|nr:hypothetical protein B6259_01865 [Ruminococcaceae bacterium CPB6]
MQSLSQRIKADYKKVSGLSTVLQRKHFFSCSSFIKDTACILYSSKGYRQKKEKKAKSHGTV